MSWSGTGRQEFEEIYEMVQNHGISITLFGFKQGMPPREVYWWGLS